MAGTRMIGVALGCGLALAAIPAAVAQRLPPPDLPDLPGTPVMSGVTYPDCREDYRRHTEPFDRAAETNRCIERLDAYHDEVLAEFRQRMIDHQQAIARVYEDQVRNNFDYTQQQADSFFERVTREHEDSNPDGRHFERYRELEARYQDDRAFLQERFCRYAGTCPDYTPPADVAERDRADGAALDTAEREERRRNREENPCRTERGAGGILGGILGGVIGSQTSLGAVGGFLAGQFTGILVAEIACQLEPEEQELAAQATEEVTQQEEVGATAEWVSPTRAEVSGSSTVTALNSRPDGSTCLDITDVAIIDGEETRVSKRMCREPGEARYTLVA